MPSPAPSARDAFPALLVSLGRRVDALESLARTTNPLLVTTLPTEPYDGFVVDYLADATNGIIWRLRYRAAATSAHKWEFLGGSRLATAESGSITTAAGSGAAETVELTGAPTITPALAGDYDVTISAFMALQVAGAANLEMFLVRNKEAAVRTQFLTFVAAAQFNGAILQRTIWLKLEAGKQYELYVGSNNKLSTSYQTARIAISPTRVG